MGIFTSRKRTPAGDDANRSSLQGFTIVELLIVIIVIGILATLILIAYNGVTNQARTATAQSDLKQNAKLVAANQVMTGQYSTAAVMPNGAAATQMTMTNYKVVTFCSNTTDFVYAVQTTAGDVYYIHNEGAVVKNNSINAFDPCTSLGISGAQTTYANLPSACSGENATCNFASTSTVAYGSATAGVFTYKTNQTSPVSCNNAYFGDPSPGYIKACYVYPN